MNKRQIGSSDLFVSEIGLGCMNLGTNQEEAKKTIDVALLNGINFLDTADLYDKGMNEEIIGSIIKSKRKDLIVATKGGNRFEREEDGWSWDPSKKHIKKAVKDSLTRLKTDYLDLYQLHGGTIEDPIDETIEAFEELKKEGVIRQYGLSSIRPNVITQYVQKSGIVSVMMQYSLLDRRPEELFPFLEQHQISVLARGSLAKGILTERCLTKASQSIQEKGYLDYSFYKLSELRSSLKQNSDQRTLQATALHFCLATPQIASALVGASNNQQLLANIAAYHKQPLSHDELAQISKLTTINKYVQHRV